MVASVPAAYGELSPCPVSLTGGYADGSACVRVSTATSSMGTSAVPAFSAPRLNVGSVQVDPTPATKPTVVSLTRSLRPAMTSVVPSGRSVAQWPAVSTFVGLMTVPNWSTPRNCVTMPTTDGKSAELATVPPTMFGVTADRAANVAPRAPTL